MTSQLQFPVTAEANLSLDAAVASKPFQDWLASVNTERFRIRSVHFQSIDMFGPKVGFIKFKADVVDGNSKFLPGIVFMRGGSVGILPVLSCGGKQYTVLTVQPRLATGRFDFEEIPAGMLDGSGNFGGVAAKELKEELQITITEAELIDLSTPAGHDRGFFVSPGATDETIRLFCFRKEVTAEELASINGRCTGVLDEGEQITLKIVPLDALWSNPDGKTIVALALFNRLFGGQPSKTADYNPMICSPDNPTCAELGHQCSAK